jgi:hypothetical protein
VFVSHEPGGITSFEALIYKIRDCVYYKKNNWRNIEGFVSSEDNKNIEYKFTFAYSQTGLRSLASVLFSMIEQINCSGAFASAPGLKNSRFPSLSGKNELMQHSKSNLM